MHLLIAKTAILNLRYKMKLIQFCFPLIHPLDEANDHINNVLSVLHELYEVYVLEHNSSVMQQSAQEHVGSSNRCTSRDVIPKLPIG
jgi:hypothetical protein